MAFYRELFALAAASEDNEGIDGEDNEGISSVRVTPVSVDEAYIELTTTTTTQAPLHSESTALTLARRVRRRIFAVTGCQVSVGIGPNPMLAR